MQVLYLTNVSIYVNINTEIFVRPNQNFGNHAKYSEVFFMKQFLKAAGIVTLILLGLVLVDHIIHDGKVLVDASDKLLEMTIKFKIPTSVDAKHLKYDAFGGMDFNDLTSIQFEEDLNQIIGENPELAVINEFTEMKDCSVIRYHVAFMKKATPASNKIRIQIPKYLDDITKLRYSYCGQIIFKKMGFVQLRKAIAAIEEANPGIKKAAELAYVEDCAAVEYHVVFRQK